MTEPANFDRDAYRANLKATQEVFKHLDVAQIPAFHLFFINAFYKAYENSQDRSGLGQLRIGFDRAMDEIFKSAAGRYIWSESKKYKLGEIGDDYMALEDFRRRATQVSGRQIIDYIAMTLVMKLTRAGLAENTATECAGHMRKAFETGVLPQLKP